jgi:malate permease and related proteins
MIISTFILLFPLFAVIAAGYLLGRLFELSEESLIRVLTDFFMPLLVFGALYLSSISLSDIARLFGAVSMMVALMMGIAFAYARISGIEFRSFAMPLIFMNSGFLGIPLMQLWGGNEAMNIIIIFDEIQTFFIFTLGFFIIGGGKGAGRMRASLTSPILWAVVLGFGANILGIPLPGPFIETCRFAGDAAPPLAAFVLGLSIHARKPVLDVHLAAGVLLRTAGGFLVSIPVVYLFGFQGVMRTVVLVTGALPAAVFSYVLPARYGIDSRRAQGIVVISTVLSVFSIPAAFTLAALLPAALPSLY